VVRPIILSSECVPEMLAELEEYPWFLPIFRYDPEARLLEVFDEEILKKVEDHIEQRARRKRKGPATESSSSSG
jgi:hypothetical protein